MKRARFTVSENWNAGRYEINKSLVLAAYWGELLGTSLRQAFGSKS
jgi:hypothetical protein